LLQRRVRTGLAFSTAEFFDVDSSIERSALIERRYRRIFIRRLDLAKAAPVSVLVWRQDFLFWLRPATERFPESDQPARLEVVAWPAARFVVVRSFPRVPLTTLDNRPVNRRPRFPSFHNGRGRRADRKLLHTCQS